MKRCIGLGEGFYLLCTEKIPTLHNMCRMTLSIILRGFIPVGPITKSRAACEAARLPPRLSGLNTALSDIILFKFESRIALPIFVQGLCAASRLARLESSMGEAAIMRWIGTAPSWSYS